MKLTNLLSDSDDSRAVSPVIGVILMVAITVILAAVIGTFVLGLGDQVESAPHASFSFDLDESSDTLTVSHRGGDTIDESDIEVRGLSSNPTVFDGSSFSAGESRDISLTDGDEGDTVNIVYISDGSETILGTYTIPEDAEFDA